MVPFLEKHKSYLIACDRPGYGGTKGSGSVQSYLDGVRSLLGHLGIEKFEIVAVSGGAPLGHLMASRFPESVRALRVVCGLGTYNKETAPFFTPFQNRSLRMRRLMPAKVAETVFNRMLKDFDPQRRLDYMLEFLNDPDREVLQDPLNREVILSSMKHARAQGAKGIVNDSAIYMRDWLRKDCDSKRLKSVPIFYFHGKKDKILNHRMTEWMHRSNPHSRLKFYDEEGHYSLPLRQVEHILRDE